MDKRLIHAVAGAGKTNTILNELRSDRRALIISYTQQNLFSLEKGIKLRFGGVVPQSIELRTYFSFLYCFCLRPFASYRLRDNGLSFGPVPLAAQRIPKSSIRHYVSEGGYFYAARAAKFVLERGVLEKVKESLSIHFDDLYVDEVQDFASNDFNLLLEIASSQLNTLCVGDYYQHTFDTSRDGNTRSGLHRKGEDSYLAEFRRAHFKVDVDSHSHSRRCSPTVCSFISKKLGIQIESARSETTEVRFVEDNAEIERLYRNESIVKLFYKEHAKHCCFSNNWGNSKGLDDYNDVCVVLSSTLMKQLQTRSGVTLKPMTKNKLYVACSRARGNLYFVDQKRLKSER